MLDLTYKQYTNKDYLINEVYILLKINKKELRKLKIETLLEIVNKLTK